MSSVRWLQIYLEENGPTPSAELEEAARLAGYRGRSLRYAKENSPIVYDRLKEYQGGLVVRLKTQEPLPGTAPFVPARRGKGHSATRNAGMEQKVEAVAERMRQENTQDSQVDSKRKSYRIVPDPATKILHVFLDADWEVRTYENTES